MPYVKLDCDLSVYYEVYDFTNPWEKSETVFFVHGFTENLNAWNSWVPHLSRKYRLVLFDIRGFGKTGPVNEDFLLTTDLLSDDMARLIEEISGEPVHIISGKSGSISAMHLAATKPELVKSLVLTCPPISAPGSAEWLPFMEEFGIRSWAEKTMQARLGYEASKEAIKWWSDMMGETNISTAKSYLKWVVTTKPWLDLKKIKCPALVITTEYTEKTNSAAGLTSQDEILRDLPQAEFFILKKDCYHAAASDPDICAQKALDFLNSLKFSD